MTASPAPAGSARRDHYALLRAIPTRWMDNDVSGHVNNVVYDSFFDTVVNATLIDHGVLDPATSPVIGLRVGHIGTSSVRYEIALFQAGRDGAVAEGHFVHVYVDRDSRRPTALPEPLRAVLTGLVMP